MSDKKSRKSLNFTLVELLIVIAIIAILASMLLPALEKARKMAYQSKCLSNLKQLAFGVIGYTDDYKSQLPKGSGSSNYMFNAFTGGGVGYYIGLPKNYSCYGFEGGDAVHGVMAWGTARCPAGGYDGLMTPSYKPAATVYPNYGYGMNGWFDSSTPVAPKNYFITLARVKRPAQRMLLGDSGADLWRSFYTGGVWGNYLIVQAASQAAFRHNRQSGYAFADGHAEIRKLTDVPALRPDVAPPSGGLTDFWRSE